MEKFLVIGERIHCISPVIRQALKERNPEPILKRAKEQIEAGADYIDVNIGPAEKDGEELMAWAVQLIQSEFDNVPLALDTVNRKAIEAGLKVYNSEKGKAILNSADAGPRIDLIDLAAQYGAKVIGLCASEGLPRDCEDRVAFATTMLERAMEVGLDPADILFDPLFLVVKGMQENQGQVLEAIRQITEMGLQTTGGLSNISNGAPKHVRPIMDAVFAAMAMQCGLSSAIINPCDKELMNTIKTCDVIKNNILYADSYLDL